MNVVINPPSVGIQVGTRQLDVSTGDPVARYVIEPYMTVEETEDGALFTVTAQGETTQATVYNGEDGFSPVVSVSPITGGHEVSITDKDGAQAFDVMDGIDGKDGKDGKDGATGATPDIYTTAVGLAAGENPYAHVSGTIEQPLITFGIPAGQAGKDGKDGTDGTDGTDGVSPDVTIASITGGHSVTITDANHPTGQTFNVMDGATGPAGTTDYNDLSNKPTIPTKVSDLSNDSGYITGMTILSYGSSTWQDFLAAYNANKVVYCRASSNSNPATGTQGRLAFMAYVNLSGTTPTSVEFQYYRSVSSHSDSQQGDQVYIYKLQSSGWTVTVREAYTKIAVGAGLTKSYSNGTLTISLA